MVVRHDGRYWSVHSEHQANKNRVCMNSHTYIHTYLQACRPYVHIVSHTGGGMLILRSCINKVIISCVASCIVLHASKKTSLLCLHAQKSHVWFIYRYYENYANGNRKVLSTLTLDGSFVPAQLHARKRLKYSSIVLCAGIFQIAKARWFLKYVSARILCLPVI